MSPWSECVPKLPRRSWQTVKGQIGMLLPAHVSLHLWIFPPNPRTTHPSHTHIFLLRCLFTIDCVHCVLIWSLFSCRDSFADRLAICLTLILFDCHLYRIVLHTTQYEFVVLIFLVCFLFVCFSPLIEGVHFLLKSKIHCLLNQNCEAIF